MAKWLGREGIVSDAGKHVIHEVCWQIYHPDAGEIHQILLYLVLKNLPQNPLRISKQSRYLRVKSPGIHEKIQ